MSKTLKKTLSIIVAIIMIATTMPFALASDGEKTVLDISKGKIVIATDYTTVDGKSIEHDLDGYIITGSISGDDFESMYGLITIVNDRGHEARFDLEFRDLHIESSFPFIDIDDDSPIELYITYKGSNSIIVNGSTVLTAREGLGPKTSIDAYIIQPDDASVDFGDRPMLYGPYWDGLTVRLNGEYIGYDLHIHERDWGTPETCKGYMCDVCWEYYGKTNERLHETDGNQTCKGYYCSFCDKYFGEADETAHKWNYGNCTVCHASFPEDMECEHEFSSGLCKICGRFCTHNLDENLVCADCGYEMIFEVITGDTVTYHNYFETAQDAAEDGSIIRLIKDCLYEYNTYLGVHKNIVIDLNGHIWNPDEQIFTVYSDIKIMDTVGTGYMGVAMQLQSTATLYDGSYKIFSTYDNKEIYDIIPDCCEVEIGSAEIGSWFNEYNDVVIKGNHNIIIDEAVAPDCRNKGLTEGKHCTECDYKVIQRTLPALTHEDTVIQVEAKAPTCTEAGWEAYEYCPSCDYTTYVEIPLNGHTPLEAVTENEVAPKCDVAGSYDLVVYCDDCGAELDRDTKTVDALTHTDADGDYICDECESQIKYVCPDCGGPAHEETGVPQYICVLITLIKLVVSLVKVLQAAV